MRAHAHTHKWLESSTAPSLSAWNDWALRVRKSPPARTKLFRHMLSELMYWLVISSSRQAFLTTQATGCSRAALCMMTDTRHGSCAAFHDSPDGWRKLVDYPFNRHRAAQFENVKSCWELVVHVVTAVLLLLWPEAEWLTERWVKVRGRTFSQHAQDSADRWKALTHVCTEPPASVMNNN